MSIKRLFKKILCCLDEQQDEDANIALTPMQAEQTQEAQQSPAAQAEQTQEAQRSPAAQADQTLQAQQSSAAQAEQTHQTQEVPTAQAEQSTSAQEEQSAEQDDNDIDYDDEEDEEEDDTVFDLPASCKTTPQRQKEADAEARRGKREMMQWEREISKNLPAVIPDPQVLAKPIPGTRFKASPDMGDMYGTSFEPMFLKDDK